MIDVKAATEGLGFLGKELRDSPLVGTVLLLIIIIATLSFTVFWQEKRYDALSDRLLKSESEKLIITNDLLRQQISVETRIQEVRRELLENIHRQRGQQKNK